MNIDSVCDCLYCSKFGGLAFHANEYDTCLQWLARRPPLSDVPESAAETAQTLCVKAYCYLEMGDIEKAVQCSREAVDTWPSSHACYTLFRALMRQPHCSLAELTEVIDKLCKAPDYSLTALSCCNTGARCLLPASACISSIFMTSIYFRAVSALQKHWRVTTQTR